MAVKASTFRIEPSVQAGLENLSRVLKRPMNQLVNEAVRDYVRRRNAEVERKLESTLASLRAYREQDPDVERAIAAVATADVRHSQEGPGEGAPGEGAVVADKVAEKVVTAKPVTDAAEALFHTEIRKLLDG
jgi:hypothetical protein